MLIFEIFEFIKLDKQKSTSLYLQAKGIAATVLSLVILDNEPNIADLKNNGVTEAELLKVKNQVKSSMVFSQERPQTLAMLYARHFINHGKLFDFDTRLKEIEEITISDINSEFSLISESVMSSGLVGKSIKPLM